MSGTSRTAAYLLNLFRPGQSLGAITAQDEEDAIASFVSRTPYPVIGATPEFIGDPTKTVDSTAAFNAACAASKIVFVAPGSYLINNFQPPSGTSLIGFSGMGFDTGADLGAVQLWALNSSTTNVIVVDNRRDLLIQGLVINGVNATTCNGVSGGGNSVTLRDLTIRQCTGWGIGGAVASGLNTPVNTEMQIDHCTIYSCGIGIGDIIDGWITSCNLSSNGTNMAVPNGGGFTVTNTRFEWSTTGYGVDISSNYNTNADIGAKIVLSGCYFDRNYNGGIRFNGCNYIDVSGSGFYRNGAVSATGSVSCQVQFTGASHIMITGCNSAAYGGDGYPGDGSALTPPVFARWSGTNIYIIISNNDLSGYTAANSATAWYSGTPPSGSYMVSRNLGTGTAGAASLDVNLS